MPLDSHFATTVCGAGIFTPVPSFHESCSKTGSPPTQDKALGTNDLGILIVPCCFLFQAGHPLCGVPMLPTGTDVRGKAGLIGDTLVQSSSQEKH